jgi:hypothetical protein
MKRLIANERDTRPNSPRITAPNRLTEPANVHRADPTGIEGLTFRVNPAKMKEPVDNPELIGAVYRLFVANESFGTRFSSDADRRNSSSVFVNK